MVAWLAGEFRNGASRRNRTKPSAKEEVQAKWEVAAPGENEFADEGWRTDPVIEAAQIYGTCRLIVVEAGCGKAGCRHVAKESFVSPWLTDACLYVREGQ